MNNVHVLPGESWRIRRPHANELPPASERLHDKWHDSHPLIATETSYFMEQRLIPCASSPKAAAHLDPEAGWEPLYLFNTNGDHDLETYQDLSNKIAAGDESCTQKFKHVLTLSRLFSPAFGLDFPPPGSKTDGRQTDTLPLCRLALTDWDVSVFKTTADGEGTRTRWLITKPRSKD